MSVGRFNPVQRVGPPAFIGVVAGVVALAGGRPVWVLGIVPGVIFSILGIRIAYDRRLAYDADRIRAATPFNAWTPVWYFRQMSGAVTFLFGLFFLGLGAWGVAALAS